MIFGQHTGHRLAACVGGRIKCFLKIIIQIIQTGLERVVRVADIGHKNSLGFSIFLFADIFIQSEKSGLIMIGILHDGTDGSRWTLKHKSVLHEYFHALDIHAYAITVIGGAWCFGIIDDLTAIELTVDVFNSELRFVNVVRKIIPLIHEGVGIVHRHIHESIIIVIQFLLQLSHMTIHRRAPLQVKGMLIHGIRFPAAEVIGEHIEVRDLIVDVERLFVFRIDRTGDAFISVHHRSGPLGDLYTFDPGSGNEGESV